MQFVSGVLVTICPKRITVWSYPISSGMNHPVGKRDENDQFHVQVQYASLEPFNVKSFDETGNDC